MGNALFTREGIRNALADLRKHPRNALLDGLRGGLLGATTDAVGYLPDAVADFMRPFGYNVAPENVVGGTEWLANRVSQPTNSLAEQSARFATGMLTPSPADFTRLGKGPIQELTVYHGSPHRINNVDAEHPMGRFDTSKIGTGEGAQAYGHGIYLAENPEVAGQYRNMVSAELPDGTTLRPGPFDDEYAGINALHKAGGDYAKAREIVRQRPNSQGELAALDALEAKGAKANQGHFYTVDLPDEQIANMLDWDAPLSQQPEAVRKALAQFASADDASITGGEFYRRLTQEMGAEPEEISQSLRQLGVPGIRYLDGNSRKTSFGPQTEGTRNFVIFDGYTAKILKRE